MARSPAQYGTLLTNMMLGIALSESITIYSLNIVLLMLLVLHYNGYSKPAYSCTAIQLCGG